MDRNGDSLSVQGQHERNPVPALARGWDVSDKIADTISATEHRMHERDGWRRVLAMIEAGEVDAVIVWKIDRLLRNLGDLEDLARLQCCLPGWIPLR
jgi:DNA invertase Pin-like site-specific DNA recombinase